VSTAGDVAESDGATSPGAGTISTQVAVLEALGGEVGLSWLPSCGRCRPCQQGRLALCEVATARRGDGTLPTGGPRLRRLSGERLQHSSALDGAGDDLLGELRAVSGGGPDYEVFANNAEATLQALRNGSAGRPQPEEAIEAGLHPWNAFFRPT
jgi:hypothetical protein